MPHNYAAIEADLEARAEAITHALDAVELRHLTAEAVADRLSRQDARRARNADMEDETRL